MSVELLDITSLNAPDFNWVYVDAAGHEHRWHGTRLNHGLPTLSYVVDDEGDDEYPSRGHYECIVCGEHVMVRTTPDTMRVMYAVDR